MANAKPIGQPEPMKEQEQKPVEPETKMVEPVEGKDHPVLGKWLEHSKCWRKDH